MLIKQGVKQSIMPIRTSKSKIYHKIQVVNNIQTDSVLNGTLNAKSDLPYRCHSNFSYISNLGYCLTTRKGRDAVS